MRTSNVVVALVIVALLNSVYGHLCIYTPRQRGDFFNGEAAQHQCFRPKVPCGGQTFSGKIASIVTGNAPFQVFFQQNLNHYSIGNTGYLSVAISRNPEPTSQDDFLPLAYVTDYYPVRQWTQTNFSVTVNLPSNFGACDHCVLQVRYVPHKPTEPIFHQCSDIKVTAASNIAQQSVPVVNEPAPLKKLSNNVTMNNGDSLYGLFQQRDHVQFVQVDTASARTAVIARLENFVISDGLTISASTPLNKIRIQNAVATADLSGSRIFYLANADTKFATPDSFPDQLLIIDARDGSFRLLPIGNTVPLSNLFYVAAKNSLYTWSIDVKQGAWALLRIDPETGRIDNSPVVVRNPADVGPYVNYLWSTYDSVQNRLITLVRHEDEPLKLDQKLYIVDFKNNFNFTEVFLNSTLYYTFSDLHFDSANQQQLLTLSPGAAPALPVTTMKKWIMIRINLEQKTSPSNHPFQAGEQDFEYLINEPFNQYLGGGVFRGLNQKAQLMYKVVQSKDDFRILSASTSGPTYSLSPVNNDLEKIYNLIYLA